METARNFSEFFTSVSLVAKKHLASSITCGLGIPTTSSALALMQRVGLQLYLTLLSAFAIRSASVSEGPDPEFQELRVRAGWGVGAYDLNLRWWIVEMVSGTNGCV
eukprot:76298-Amorphochlora_amoeboformis.AAC.1